MHYRKVTAGILGDCLLAPLPAARVVLHTSKGGFVDEEKERIRFEAWAEGEQPWLLEKAESDNDRLLRLTAWEAWKASRAAALEEAKAACQQQEYDFDNLDRDMLVHNNACTDRANAINKLKEQQ